MFFLQRSFRLAAEDGGWPEEERSKDASTTKAKRKQRNNESRQKCNLLAALKP
jgi:hypothetical protein